MDRRRAAGALLALAACIACSAAAPTAGNHSTLDLYDGAVVEGCYYNFQHYGEGDRIMTNEPCLNCTCHNRMLMCYLRVCPFTKPIGQNCTVEKRADQCCPIVTCPDVPVDLLTSTSTSSPAEYGATGVGKYDKYGCSIDGKYLPEGAKVPPTPNKPCEHCYCIRNMTTCVMQECTLHVDGCTPIYHKDVCCPVRYSCDHPEDEIPLLDDMTTTVRPTPGFILTTTTPSPVTQISQDCVHDDQIFADGALIKTEKACEHCYCMKGDIVCVVQECGTPMENEGKNCTSLPPREGQCCPDTYICEGDESSTENLSELTTNLLVEELTTLSPPRRVGVEGSGYRNEPDEVPLTELPPPVYEHEGSGEDKGIDSSETSVASTLSSSITEEKMITPESVITEKMPLGSTGDQGVETVHPDIINNEKSTTEPSTKDDFENISLQTSDSVLGQSEEITTESAIYVTEKQSEKETTESYDKPLITTSSPQVTTTLSFDKKEPEETVSKTTSSPIFENVDKVTEEIVIKTTSDGKVGFETSESTTTAPHTLTLEEVEKGESELDQDVIGTEKSTEELSTESHEYISSSETPSIASEEEPQTTHIGADEDIDNEITDTYEFIPVTTGIPTINLEHAATETDKEDGVTEKEPDVEKYETPQHVTNIPHAETELLTQHKVEISTEAAENYSVSESENIIPSTTSTIDTHETESSNIGTDNIIGRTTESSEYISAKTDTPTASSERAEESLVTDFIPSDKETTTMTPPFEEKDHTTDIESKLHMTTTASIVESSVDYQKTTVPDLEKELQTSSINTGEVTTSLETNYVTSSESSILNIEKDDVSTEPDKGLNTIPADNKEENIITPTAQLSDSENDIIKTDEIGLTTESGIIKDDLSEKTHGTTTEFYLEKESSTLSRTDIFDNAKLPEEHKNIYTIPTSSDSGHEGDITDSTTEILLTTAAPQSGFEKDTSTEKAAERTDMPEVGVDNQRENEVLEDKLVPGRIPGEGDCLLNGITYRNESDVPSTNNCHTACKCISSIIKCDPIICSPPPDYMDNCQPTYDPPDACCPTYECTHISKETMPPQSQSQMSGTEAPHNVPSFECRGDQCELTEDKEKPTASHETCIEGDCKEELDKKIESSSLPDSPVTGSNLPVICTNGKCASEEENSHSTPPCDGEDCVIQSGKLPDSVSEKCESEGNCKEESITPGVTEQIKPTEHKVICKEETGCQETLEDSTCEGDTCKTQQTPDVEAKLPSTCTDSECLKPSDTTSEHKFETHLSTSVGPIEDITTTEKSLSNELHSKDETTPKTQDKIDETTKYTEGIEGKPETEGVLDSTLEPQIEKETESVETEIKGSTIKQEDTDVSYIIEKPDKSIGEEYVTEKEENILSITQKIEEEGDKTETSKLDDMHKEQTTHEVSDYTTEPETKEDVQHTSQAVIDDITTANPDVIKPLDSEGDALTESYGAVLEKETESYGSSTNKDYDNKLIEQAQDSTVTKYDPNVNDVTMSQSIVSTTELSNKYDDTDLTEDTHSTESNIIAITTGAEQITTVEIHSTQKQTAEEKTTQVPNSEFKVPENTDLEKHYTESVIPIDLPQTTTAPITDTVTLGQNREPSDTHTSVLDDKREDLNQGTTDSLTFETSTKSDDSVLSMITTTKHSTNIPETYSTISEDVIVTTNQPYKEKSEPPTTSDVDKEEYITEEPGLSGSSDENFTTVAAEAYITDSEPFTAAPEQGEDSSKISESGHPSLKPDTGHEIETDSYTTKQPISTDLGEIEPILDQTTEQPKLPTTHGEIYSETDKLTTEAIILSSLEKEVENKTPSIIRQEDISTDNSSTQVTDKIQTEVEKENIITEKPLQEEDSNKGTVSVSETYIDISTEKTVDESPSEESTEKDENSKLTTPEDKTSYVEQETSVKPIESDLDSQTTVSIEPSHSHENDLLPIEPVSTTSEPITITSEQVTKRPTETATEMHEIVTKLPESESHTATSQSLTKETETMLPPTMEFETSPTNIPLDINIKETTITPPVVSDQKTDSEAQADLSTEHSISDMLGSTVFETKKEDEDTYVTTTEKVLITDVSKDTKNDKVSEDKEHDMTSSIKEDKHITPETSTDIQITTITDIPVITSVDIEQSSVPSAPNFGVIDSVPPESDSKVDVSPEENYAEQTEKTNVLSTKPSDIYTTLPEILSSKQEEIQTISPLSMVTEISVKPEKDLIEHKDLSTQSPEDTHDENKYISPIHMQHTTDITISGDISEHSEGTTPLLQLSEETPTPKYETSESTPDVVELEEHTHKLLEDYSTTPRIVSEEEIHIAGSTQKPLEETSPSFSPDSETEASYTKVTEQVLQDIDTTQKSRPEEEPSHTKVTEEFAEELLTTKRPSSNKDNSYVESTTKITEETATTPRFSFEKETGSTQNTDNIFEEVETTSHPSFEQESGHGKVTETVQEGITTSSSPIIERVTEYVEPTDKILEETLTTLPPVFVEDTVNTYGPHIVEEDTVTTTHSEKEFIHDIKPTSYPSHEEETSHSINTDKVLEDSSTPSYSSVEKVTSHTESSDNVSEGFVTTTLAQEIIKVGDSTEKDLAETITTTRYGEETGHESSTHKFIKESETTPQLSSEKPSIYSESTDKALDNTATTIHPIEKEEVSHGEETEKITDEATTTPLFKPDNEYIEVTKTNVEDMAITQIPDILNEVSAVEDTDKVIETSTPIKEEEISYGIATDNIMYESTTSQRPSSDEEGTSNIQETDKISEMSTTTPRFSPEEHISTSEKSLEHTVTTQVPTTEEKLSHAEDTDKVLEQATTTSQPSFEKVTIPSETTTRITEHHLTSQSFDETFSHTESTEKNIEELTTSLHTIQEDGTFDTTVDSQVFATTARSVEEIPSHTGSIDKISEGTSTTIGIINIEDEKLTGESQKLEPSPTTTTEGIFDKQTEITTEKLTEIKEETESPGKIATETDLTTARLETIITTQPPTNEEETDVKHTTERPQKDISTDKPSKDTEESSYSVPEEKPSEAIKPQEMVTLGEEILHSTTKMTTIEEYVTTHKPSSVDKFSKPEEKPSESGQSSEAPELPKPSEIQPTDEVPSPEEESHFPPSGSSGYGEPDYGDEDQAFGPGTCRYGGKVYVSAQQIPRDDPCDFCFCFRSDIICLQQSCPPPIHGCHEEPIQGFCCPRYECPVSMATTLNVTTTTTTTTTTLPPHFPTHSYKGAAQRRGCQIKGHTYKVGDVVRASSGPCLHCTCGGDGQMKCDPKVCTPEPMLRQMIAAAVSAKRRR